MSAYLIFVDGLEHDANRLVAELGLEQIERGESGLVWLRVEDGGPGGRPGMLGFWMDMRHSGNEWYRPETQRWTRAPGGKFWVGVNLDRPLTPADIERKNLPRCRTKGIQLEDGHLWQVPIAKSLPHVWGLDEQGRVDRRAADPFADFCGQAEKLFQLFALTNQPTQLALELGDDFLSRNWDYDCQALGLIYKLAPPVISALGLLGDMSAAMVMAATMELEAIEAVESQKKTSDEATTLATSPT